MEVAEGEAAREGLAGVAGIWPDCPDARAGGSVGGVARASASLEGKRGRYLGAKPSYEARHRTMATMVVVAVVGTPVPTAAVNRSAGLFAYEILPFP